MEYLFHAILFFWALIWLVIVLDTLVDVVFKPKYIKEWFDSPMYDLDSGYWYKSIGIWFGVATIALAWPIILIYKGLK